MGAATRAHAGADRAFRLETLEPRVLLSGSSASALGSTLTVHLGSDLDEAGSAPTGVDTLVIGQGLAGDGAGGNVIEGLDGGAGFIDVAVDTGIGSGSLPLTPAQGEGPYYPQVTVAHYDNDLVRLP